MAPWHDASATLRNVLRAVQAGRRMIARGERPLFRVTLAPDVSS